MKTVIFDLDGTLANIKHRLHYIESGGKMDFKPDWDAFNANVKDDEPIEELCAIAHAMLYLPTQFKVQFFTGRNESARTDTVKWLTNNVSVRCNYAVLRMRPNGDYTEDSLLKESWLKEMVEKPDLVFDDRQQVVDMWRRNGIRCAQVAPGNF